MNDKELAKRLRILREEIEDEGERIRRYSVASFLREPDVAGQPDPGAKLRAELQQAWERWAALKVRLRALAAAPTTEAIDAVEADWERLERDLDLVQRELISQDSYKAGVRTVTWLLAALAVLIGAYLFTHGVRSADLSTFEPWPEWGPLKYGEVAFWSAFGALCALLYKAARYLARRDFDQWYKPWYVVTFVRAPFLSVVLMMVVLEFVEWYGEDTWIQTYLLEEGSKFYFIVFLSFSLGLTTDTTAGIMRDLAEGVSEFVSRAVGRVADKLSSAVSKDG
ncbi:MAG: hypothetical protein NTV51_00605, partial [Verrucomicrobia bacterium]|nr:hypothetical protein [Verrucomicrobiota bacterium]